eukprot:1042816-Rhodomonas_salina.2
MRMMHARTTEPPATYRWHLLAIASPDDSARPITYIPADAAQRQARQPFAWSPPAFSIAPLG